MSTASTRAATSTPDRPRTAASTSSWEKAEALRLQPEERRHGPDLRQLLGLGYYGLASCGFCKEGEALDFIHDGRVELDGELPLNAFGGSLGTNVSSLTSR
jgi:acetyl-CoA acetyltransferase